MQIDDETLMALADGELDAERADAVRRAVDADPELQARLFRFTETRRLLGGLREDPGQDAGEDPLAAMIRAAAAPASAPASASAMPPMPEPANTNRRPWLAAAASVAIAAFAFGWWQNDKPGPQAFGQPEIAALDELRTGQVRGLDDGTQLSMIASFRGSEGQLCREYEAVNAGTVRTVLACRGSEGWVQRFAALAATEEGTFQPASGESSIDAALQAVGAGAPLTPEEEAAALGDSAEGLPPS
ncbi:anti-sigma factor family protein [Paracoccus laeviglucosivorans]|uniref:Transmembrane transcriptional regulator (Anti-sigma factor RsiW) n=1 Tax=Paracoccus laeviglucosivorans TaxID=1197861 RepID=A0A521B9V6_9RHOB|nr:hypothetical protein [Paracoccus laeviglucosivorans]SMO43884.1 hypothetical protein SAMN06265221_102175 [Paracoccus laeviglucosivorans]